MRYSLKGLIRWMVHHWSVTLLCLVFVAWLWTAFAAGERLAMNEPPAVVTQWMRDSAARAEAGGYKVRRIDYIGGREEGTTGWYVYLVRVEGPNGSRTFPLSIMTEGGAIVSVE